MGEAYFLIQLATVLSVTFVAHIVRFCIAFRMLMKKAMEPNTDLPFKPENLKCRNGRVALRNNRGIK